MPGRSGNLLNARLRYFDPDRKRAGVPEDVAALVSELSDTRTTVTLVNVNPSQARTLIVQGGGYAEHQLVSVTRGGKTTPIDSPFVTVRLAPGSGETLVLTMKRYANTPTALPLGFAEGRTAAVRRVSGACRRRCSRSRWSCWSCRRGIGTAHR